jgi:hypothetical protein
VTTGEQARSSPVPDESEAQRLNRNYEDLLQELRVSQNGTQILFAFLLTVPFSNGFRQVTTFERGVYFAALLLSALSAALLIAPAVMHRVLFRHDQKAELVLTAGRLALGGQTLLLFAVSTSVFLVGDYLYGHLVATITAAGVTVWTAVWFFALPLWMRVKHGHRAADNTSST